MGKKLTKKQKSEAIEQVQHLLRRSMAGDGKFAQPWQDRADAYLVCQSIVSGVNGIGYTQVLKEAEALADEMNMPFLKGIAEGGA